MTVIEHHPVKHCHKGSKSSTQVEGKYNDQYWIAKWELFSGGWAPPSTTGIENFVEGRGHKLGIVRVMKQVPSSLVKQYWPEHQGKTSVVCLGPRDFDAVAQDG